MEVGSLTPKSNDLVEAMRFTGAFGQSDGFGSVLLAEVKKDGRLVLTLTYQMNGQEHFWSVELDDSQRNALVAFAGKYQPRLFERVK